MDPKLVSNWLNVEINVVSNSLKDYELENEIIIKKFWKIN